MSSTLQTACSKVVDDAIDRMHELVAENRATDAIAVYEEIKDWLVQKEDLDVLSLIHLEEYE